MSEISVLILDENDDVRRELSRGLAGAGGMRVIADTANPVTAAELAHLEKPDIILLDFDRRGPLRVQMTEWIREVSPKCALVVFTSYLQNGEAEEFKQAGATACLLKGLTIKQLAEEIRRIVAARLQPNV